jgi:hypothetical protein
MALLRRRTPGPRQRSLLHAKVALVAVGLGTWLYGYRVDDDRLTWLAIAFLAAAFLLRLVPERSARDGGAGDGGDAPDGPRSP